MKIEFARCLMMMRDKLEVLLGSRQASAMSAKCQQTEEEEILASLQPLKPE